MAQRTLNLLMAPTPSSPQGPSGLLVWRFAFLPVAWLCHLSELKLPFKPCAVRQSNIARHCCPVALATDKTERGQSGFTWKHGIETERFWLRIRTRRNVRAEITMP